jgi:hypothetical protein
MRALTVTRLCSLASGLVLLWSGWAAASVPGSGWSIAVSSNPSGSWELTSISCPSVDACVAVGVFGGALVRRSGSGGWVSVPTPAPTNARGIELRGVSCTSLTACVAVGSYSTPSGQQLTLAERWDGTGWEIQPTPNSRAFKDGELLAVSCTAPAACTAVGDSSTNTDYDYIEAPLAERWNGSRWTIQPTRERYGGSDSALTGVSCWSPEACTAVGLADGQGTLAERWDGIGWKIQLTPNPKNEHNAELDSVSCFAENRCIAVGSAIGSPPKPLANLTLAERWNGTAWKIQRTPNPTRPASNLLRAVSCASIGACTAVGFPYPEADTTLAERWNGSEWTIQATPKPATDPSTEPVMFGVSCPSVSRCIAVGGYTNPKTSKTLTEYWTP